MSCATLPYPSPPRAGLCAGAGNRARPVDLDAALARGVCAVTAAVWRAYREAARRQRTRQALAELSPHMLRDIGVTPAAARHEASKPWWII
jgi:uncharacterized protein YjiS (DUF1127 family)